jgi:hypothetical protein
MANPKPLPGAGNDTNKGRKGRSRPTGGTSGDGDAVDERTSSDKQQDRLTALLEQFGGGGFRLLAERLDNAGEPEYLGPVPFDSELYETVRQRWGGGRYGGRIVDERSKYKARISPFRIGGAPRNGNDVANASNPPASNATGLETILNAINANLAALAAKQQAPAVDPVDHVVKIARALKETSQAPVVAASVDPFEQMRNMLGLLNELRDNAAPSAPESNFGLVLKEGIGPLVQVFNRKLDIEQERETRRRGNGTTATARVVQPDQSATAHEEPVIPSDELEALLLTIPTPARRFLLGCAENDEDAEDYVPLLLNKLSDEAYEAMRRNLPRDDFLDVLVKVVPAYAQHREWFAGLVDALRETVAAATANGDGGQAAPLAQGAEA